MNSIMEKFRNPLYAAIAGFVIGLLVGLPILGWWLWPVQWTDGEPKDLRSDLKTDFLCMIIDSHMRNPIRGDVALSRFESLGEEGQIILAGLKPGDCGLNENDLTQFRLMVNAPVVSASTPVVPVPTTTAPEEDKGKSNIGMILLLCLALLAVGGALVYFLLLRKPKQKTTSINAQAQEMNRQVQPTDFEAAGKEEPIAQYMTTYMQGDDLYDDSFSIDSPTGEFLGECGVGISETIGVGEPKKVTAFEVWLFDKNDPQTVTKVLMSEHAFNDPIISQRLASKGEPFLMEAGHQVTLETATLMLEARVVDMSYGAGALPANSNFDRMTLELAIWPKS